MYGLSPSERAALDQLHLLARNGRVGSHWDRRTRTHLAEISALVMVHPELRSQVATALTRLAEADRCEAPLDAATVTVVEGALDALQREGGFELRRWAADLREEVEFARGRTLKSFLAPPVGARGRVVPTKPMQVPAMARTHMGSH